MPTTVPQVRGYHGPRQTSGERNALNKVEEDPRRDVVERCRELNASGINQGTSGNIPVRYGTRILISPSPTPNDTMEPGMVASMSLEDESGAREGSLKPSAERPFRNGILRERPDANAVVHAHPADCTTLAIARKEIPACHCRRSQRRRGLRFRRGDARSPVATCSTMTRLRCCRRPGTTDRRGIARERLMLRG